MPYALPSRIDREEPEIVGGTESQTSTSERDGDPETPPTTPEHTAHSSGLGQEEEPHDLIFVTPPEGDRPLGTMKDRPAKGEEDTKGNFSEQLDELAAPPNQPTPAEIPAGADPPPAAGPDAPTEDLPPPVRDEGWQSPGPEPVATSTPPSSPAAGGLDNPAVPPFQFTQPLDLSSNSRRNDFASPNGEVTRPYQRHLGKTFMRATDWTYYHAQDEANPTEYHPDWPNGMRQMGPILVPGGE